MLFTVLFAVILAIHAILFAILFALLFAIFLAVRPVYHRDGASPKDLEVSDIGLIGLFFWLGLLIPGHEGVFVKCVCIKLCYSLKIGLQREADLLAVIVYALSLERIPINLGSMVPLTNSVNILTFSL